MPANDTPFRALEPLRLRYLDSPVPGWLRSAGEAVLDLLPAGLRRTLGAQPRLLLVRVDGDQLQLLAGVDGRIDPLGRVPSDDPELLTTLQSRLESAAADVPRWLLVDGGQVLRRVIVLPASAESRLRDVLVHEIDRQTPFPADQVVFEPRVVSRDAVNKQIRVELVVLPLARLQSLLDAVGPLAPGLSGVDVRDTDGTRLGVNLLPSAQRGVRGDRAGRINLVIGAVIVAVLFVAMLLALSNRSQALAELTDQVTLAKKQAHDVRVLRNGLGGSVDAANFLARQRAQQPTIIELLNDLTNRIPDDTVLEKISFNEGRVVLVGQSRQAAALVGLLQASALIKTPALAGAMQPDPRTGMDRFTLTATVVGSPQEVADGNAQADR
jgi:general secretion pathway protein L